MTEHDKNLPSTVSVDENNSFTFDSVYQEYLKWLPKYEEFSQGRTNFQIEKFVALADGTPANNYNNVLYQTRVMRGEFMREVKRGIELQRNFDYRWNSHLEKFGTNVPLEVSDGDGGTKFVWYDLEKTELDHSVHELRLSIKDKIQQLSTFDAILNKLEENNGGPFTKEQYEKEAPLYWEKRFESQSIDDLISSRLGISTGNAKSIRQALASPILDGSHNQVTNENPLIKKLINGDFDVIEAIKEGNESIRKLQESNTTKNFLPKNDDDDDVEVKKVENQTDTVNVNDDPYKLSEEMLSELLKENKTK